MVNTRAAAFTLLTALFANLGHYLHEEHCTPVHDISERVLNESIGFHFTLQQSQTNVSKDLHLQSNEVNYIAKSNEKSKNLKHALEGYVCSEGKNWKSLLLFLSEVSTIVWMDYLSDLSSWKEISRFIAYSMLSRLLTWILVRIARALRGFMKGRLTQKRKKEQSTEVFSVFSTHESVRYLQSSPSPQKEHEE